VTLNNDNPESITFAVPDYQKMKEAGATFTSPSFTLTPVDTLWRLLYWEGTVCTLEQHVAKCRLTLVPCPNKCINTGNKINCFTRRDLDNRHLKDCPNRDYFCRYCGEKGTYTSVTEVHDLVCKKKILLCSNAGCSEMVERQNIDEHNTKCPHTVISCKYKGIGCTSQLKKKYMPAHEQLYE
jgi:hypothetical protein